ncbi:MAG TPA: asparagine synthase-related protein [Allosphingosinicella sp.]|nr:asparagine synthase-related protein [Allosphingosinicella sp.]
MTAIAGYWSLDHRPDAAARCERMLKSQQIYGPQVPAMASDGAITLGQRLFGIAPEDRRRQRVASGSGGTTLLVADARLDNREELYEALAIPAGPGSALTDSEMILRALERWGDDAPERLHGDFAFAFWDSRRQRLLLGRDYMGQQPLHYARRGGFFAFASMPKGLHALPELPPSPDREAVAGFLALMPEDGSETFFHGIEKVRAGEIVAVTREGLQASRWWRPALAPLGLKRPEDYAEALREQMERAVAVRLRGTGSAVAAHLSGGLDSGAVAATAARLMAERGGRVTAYTGVPREGYDSSGVLNAFADEGPYAESVAALYPNMDHVLVHNGGSPLADLDRYFFVYERPVLNLCNSVWMHRILDRARERGHRVLLSGNRGNTSFSYDGMPYLTQLLSSGRLIRLARESLALVRNGTRFGSVAAQIVGPFLPVPLWQAISRLRGKGRKVTDYTALGPEAALELRIAERAAERGLDLSYRPRRDPLETRLWSLRRVDPGNYNKGVLAGWGVDVRDPTADRRLVEFCLAVPSDQYLQGGVRRSLARRAFADRLPAAVVNETRKGYQAADWHEGLAAAGDILGEELTRIEANDEAGRTVSPAMMRALAEAMPSDQWHKAATTEKYRLALLRGISAGHFIRKAAGSNQ